MRRWDHIILDLIICNTGGMILGLWLIRVFGMKEYKWSLKKQQSTKSWLANFGDIFNPQLERHDWRVFSSSKRFIQVIFVMSMVSKTHSVVKSEGENYL